MNNFFMRNLTFGLLLCALIPGGAGCGDQAADAGKPLQESFKEAAPEVQQAIATVTTELRAGNVMEATRTLAPVISGQPLSDQQKQAVGLALKQINQSVTQNPNLDTKEMYELRAKMFQAVHDAKKEF